MICLQIENNVFIGEFLMSEVFLFVNGFNSHGTQYEQKQFIQALNNQGQETESLGDGYDSVNSSDITAKIDNLAQKYDVINIIFACHGGLVFQSKELKELSEKKTPSIFHESTECNASSA